MGTQGHSIQKINLIEDFLELDDTIISIPLYGSYANGTNDEKSDIDLLITFNEPSDLSLFDLMDLKAEFSEMFKRAVDIVEPSAIRNPIRRKNIFASSELIYAA